LNPYSQRFAERLFVAHPEWRTIAQRDPTGFPAPGSLLVTVQSPVAGRELWIRTYGDQVTVDFGQQGWHEHFGPGTATDEAGIFDAAIGFIDDLLNDRKVVATRYLFGRPLWSRAMDASRAHAPLFGRTAVISWSGRKDATLASRR
jgi:hypothetical protein